MATPDFVRVAQDGRGFTLRGSPFYFCGANTYYCMARAIPAPPCSRMQQPTHAAQGPRPAQQGQIAMPLPLVSRSSISSDIEGRVQLTLLNAAAADLTQLCSSWPCTLLRHGHQPLLACPVQTRAAEPSLRHEVTEVLDAMAATGLAVLRTWAFNDGEAQWNALQPRPGALFCTAATACAGAARTPGLNHI
jgi:hypothetical protein